jgi:hypothetical protein
MWGGIAPAETMGTASPSHVDDIIAIALPMCHAVLLARPISRTAQGGRPFNAHHKIFVPCTSCCGPMFYCFEMCCAFLNFLGDRAPDG